MTYTYVPFDDRLAELERRVLRAFPEQFDIAGRSFIALEGIGSDMHRLLILARNQRATLRGVQDALAIISVVEELLGRCERTLADYAEMDAWMEREHAAEAER